MNKVKPVNISITEDTKYILEDLDCALKEIGITRSLWFRRVAIDWVKKYRNFDKDRFANV